jgi:hypothetical protein
LQLTIKARKLFAALPYLNMTLKGHVPLVLQDLCCERNFALMNRIHTYLRSRLGGALLNNLLCICSLGHSIPDFDPKPIVAKWLEAPFLQKNGSERSSQGKHNALMAASSSRIFTTPERGRGDRN